METVKNYVTKSSVAIVIDLIANKSRILEAVDDAIAINLDIETHITQNDHFVYAACITTHEREITKDEHTIKCIDLRRDQSIPIDVCPAIPDAPPQDPRPKKKRSKKSKKNVHKFPAPMVADFSHS